MNLTLLTLKLTAACAAVIAIPTLSQTALGASIAADAANDFAYDDSWASGDNGGAGFGAWSIFTNNNNPSTGGNFIGDSANNGAAPSGNINTAGESFGMYANSGDASIAARDFTGGPLAAGQTFSLDMDNGFISTSSSVGFELRDSSGIECLVFRFQGGDSFYEVIDGSGFQTTLEPFTDDGLSIDVTLGPLDSYVLRIDGVINAIGTLMTPNPAQFRLFNNNAGSGGSNDAFFNSFAVTNATLVPEPSCLVLLGFVTGSFFVVRCRRRG
jgi:hypothetical protein